MAAIRNALVRAWNQESAESGIEQFREIFCAFLLAPRVKGDGKALECCCDSNECRNQRFLIRVAPNQFSRDLWSPFELLLSEPSPKRWRGLDEIQERDDLFLVVQKELDGRIESLPQGEPIVVFFAPGFEGFGNDVADRIEDEQHDVFLIREIPQERAPGHPGCTGKVREGDLVETCGAELIERDPSKLLSNCVPADGSNAQRLCRHTSNLPPQYPKVH